MFLFERRFNTIRVIPEIQLVAGELLNAGGLFMLVGSYKQDQSWRTRTYPVPTPSRSGFRWKASALRKLQRWSSGSRSPHPATIMVPALYNLMPGENLAMGWLNEIDALSAIHQRMICAAKITGWDVFTFHTLHNRDRYFDSTINAVRDTWVKEGKLSAGAVLTTKRQFGKPYDYYNVPARLVENLVFQSSLLDWVARRGSEVPLRFHVIGTALLSALVSSGSITMGAAVQSILKFGSRWDETLRTLADAGTDDEIGWSRFQNLRKLMEGRSRLSLAVAREDLPAVEAPLKPFWYSPTAHEEAVPVTTAREAAAALEAMNLSSWSFASLGRMKSEDEPVRGWLVSPLHPMAKLCRWSVSNYLLATPASASLFIDHIATLGRAPVMQIPETPLQNRFRLSRIKVTGP